MPQMQELDGHYADTHYNGPRDCEKQRQPMRYSRPLSIEDAVGLLAEIYALADVVHVACGGHAGDDTSMSRVTALCAAAVLLEVFVDN